MAGEGKSTLSAFYEMTDDVTDEDFEVGLLEAKAGRGEQQPAPKSGGAPH